MNIENLFSFLTNEYGLSYKFQEFTNCYNGNWIVQAFSFFNDGGCFTLVFLPQRNELEFYRSNRFSTNHDELFEEMVDVYSIAPEIWNKHTRIWGMRRPFFWWSTQKVLKAFAEALKVHLSKEKQFFGIKV